MIEKTVAANTDDHEYVLEVRLLLLMQITFDKLNVCRNDYSHIKVILQFQNYMFALLWPKKMGNRGTRFLRKVLKVRKIGMKR